jgi:putative peptidoglycan lipid II flippase
MSLKRASLNLSIIKGLSILLAFLFHIALAREFGVSGELDSLFVSLTIFSFVGIANSFLTSLFVPIFSEVRQEDEADSFIFADVVIKWSAGLAFMVGLFSWIYCDLIIKAVASGFEGERFALAIDITRLLLIALVFFSISATTICILNALYHFSMPAIAGLLHPTFNIAFLYILSPSYGVKAIAMAYVTSNFLQALILILYLKRNTQWKPTKRLFHERIPSLVRESSRMSINGIIWSLRELISRNIASHFPSGSITLLAYAEKLVTLFVQVAISPLAKVFYSRASAWMAEKRWEDLGKLLERIMKVNVTVIFFVSSGAAVFLVPFLNILFLGSRFTPADIQVLFSLVLIMLLYLIVLSYETHFVQIAYAARRTDIVGINAILGVMIFLGTAWLLSRFFGVYGLAMSISITQVVVSVLYYWFVARIIPVSSDQLVFDLVRCLAISLFFSISGLVSRALIENDLIVLILVMPIWSLGFFITIKTFILSDELAFISFREIYKSG